MISLVVALVIGAIGVGGGVYETLIVDPLWLENLAIIQPLRGGLDRKRFWIPIHSLYEVALLVGVWSSWNEAGSRSWLLGAVAAHVAARAWSFAYFIPNALRFEKLSELTAHEITLARQWIRLSRWRPILEAVSILSIGAAIVHLGSSSP